MIKRQTIPDVGASDVKALEPLLVELSRSGRSGRHVRAEASADIPAAFQRKAPLRLPELTEPQVVRHYPPLAQLNYSVDTGIYPLGSCTMK
jgi:glycine dehydrogenase subunit 2